MSTIKVVGIDIAKSVFQVCVWMADGSVAWNRKNISPETAPHDAPVSTANTDCYGSLLNISLLGRTLISMDYDVKLIPTQHVKAFARHQKNDANDALAICETLADQGSTSYQLKLQSNKISRRYVVLASS